MPRPHPRRDARARGIARAQRGGAAPALWDLPEGVSAGSAPRTVCACALDLASHQGILNGRCPAPSGGHAPERGWGRGRGGKSHIPSLRPRLQRLRGLRSWDGRAPSLTEEAWSPGSGPLSPVPRKSHKPGPQPLGPKTNCQVWNFRSLEGRARGKGQGFPEHPLVVWGLEGLGW